MFDSETNYTLHIQSEGDRGAVIHNVFNFIAIERVVPLKNMFLVLKVKFCIGC